MKKGMVLLMILMLFCGVCLAETAPASDGAEVSPEKGAGEAWIPAVTEAQPLPEDAQAAFDKATGKLLGAAYTPVALLATRSDDSGTSYCILCQIAAVVPNAVPTWNLVYIHVDQEGNVRIMNNWEIYIDRHAQP